MKKKLTLLILLFPVWMIAQEVKNGAIIFDMHPNKNKQQQTDTTQTSPYSSDDDDEQQQQKKKVKQPKEPMSSGLYTAADYKREGLFKAWFHAGINGAQIDGDSYFGYNQIGLDAGVGLMVRFHKYFSFTTSLDYSMKGARQKLAFDPNVPSLSKYQVQWDYIELPLMINVHDKDLIMFGLGLQPGVMVRYQQWDQNGDNVTANPPEGQPRPFDLEGVAALHFLVIKKVTLGIKFSYSLLKVRGPTLGNRLNGQYNNLLTLDVGYILSTVKKK